MAGENLRNLPEAISRTGPAPVFEFATSFAIDASSKGRDDHSAAIG